MGPRWGLWEIGGERTSVRVVAFLGGIDLEMRCAVGDQVSQVENPGRRVAAFSLHWPVVASWAAMLIGVLVFFGLSGAFSDWGRAVHAGMAIGKNALLCLGVSWIAFRIAGRSKKAASIAFGVMVALSAVSFVIIGVQSTLAGEREEAVRSFSSEARDRQIDAAMRGDLHAANAEADALGDRVLAEAAHQSGDRRIGLQVSSELIKKMKPVRDELAAAYHAFKEAGSIEASTLGTRELIEGRIVMVDRLLRAAGDVETNAAEVVASARDLLIQKGASKKYAESWTKGFSASVNGASAVRVRQIGVELAQASRRVLEIHSEHFGRILIDADGELVADLPDETLNEFNQIIDRIAELADEQSEAIRAHQAALKSGSRLDAPDVEGLNSVGEPR